MFTFHIFVYIKQVCLHLLGCQWHGHFQNRERGGGGFFQDLQPCKNMPQNCSRSSSNIHRNKYSTLHKSQFRHIDILKKEYDINSIIIWACDWQDAKKSAISLSDFIKSWEFSHTYKETISKFLKIDPYTFTTNILSPRSCIEHLKPRKALKSGLASCIKLFFDANEDRNKNYSLHFLDCNRYIINKY